MYNKESPRQLTTDNYVPPIMFLKSDVKEDSKKYIFTKLTCLHREVSRDLFGSKITDTKIFTPILVERPATRQYKIVKKCPGCMAPIEFLVLPAEISLLIKRILIHFLKVQLTIYPILILIFYLMYPPLFSLSNLWFSLIVLTMIYSILLIVHIAVINWVEDGVVVNSWYIKVSETKQSLANKKFINSHSLSFCDHVSLKDLMSKKEFKPYYKRFIDKNYNIDYKIGSDYN